MSCCEGGASGFAVGELAGIGIPGVCVWGEAASTPPGLTRSGSRVAAGAVAGEGITIPGVCPVWPGAGETLLGLADPAPLAAGSRFALRFAFRFGAAFGFGFGLLMPGMLWPSCCANTSGAETMTNSASSDKIVACLNL